MKYVLPHSVSRLRGATLPDGSVVDVDLVRRGEHVVVSAVRATDEHAPDAEGSVDLRGYVLMTAPAEPHAHLDKALSWDALQPPLGDLHDAIANWKQGSASFDEKSFRLRAREAAISLVRNGTTAVRSHVDILAGDDPLRGIRAVVRVRNELRGLIDIEIAALCKVYSSDDLVYAALDAGADLVGGSPHSAPDPIGDLNRLLDIAEARGVGVDLHTDEFLEGDHYTIAAFADRVREWPADRIRTAGHCTRLGTMEPGELKELIPRIVASGLGVVANPITNLYLQGRDHPVSMPRGITAIEPLRAGGVCVAAGADNVRDPFNPIGRSDALETAALTITAAHVRPEVALAMVTDDARTVMGLPQAGARVGARAEFLAVRGTSVLDVIANAPADRIVIHNGAIVSVSETRTRTAAPAL
ncbi:amidohydrolase family protein [Williamsia sp. 1135]|uniref:amidohydrolase family protein n=1 Tax=Williamsia sp. 1135 TaxID=1889262 RepID=UPI000A10DB26|nr:amidohydrolase family protein [Williamsia sp. 1135]ORM28748.1 cytosine deaminase [Williamsia sp. 1135]